MSNSDTNATNPGSNGPGYYHKPQTPSPSQRFTDLERAFHRATLDRKAVLACNSVCSSKAPTPPPATAAKNASEGQGASASSLMMPVSVPPPPPQPGTATNANTTTDLGSIGQGEGLSTVPVSNPVSTGWSSVRMAAISCLSFLIISFFWLAHNCITTYPSYFFLAVRNANVPVWSEGAAPTYDADQFHRKCSAAEPGLDASPDG